MSDAMGNAVIGYSEDINEYLKECKYCKVHYEGHDEFCSTKCKELEEFYNPKDNEDGSIDFKG